MSAFLGQSLFAAGSGTIKGKILDSLTGDPLIGVKVIVLDTSIRDSTDTNLDGEFIIHDVPIGEKTVKISYIGYFSITEQVVVPDSGVVEKEFRLKALPIEGQEILVDNGTPRGQRAAIYKQLASSNVNNVVSSEKMQELSDPNIAESLGRLPGVTLNRQNGEADQVVIRGMSPQFNNVTIEGVPMVSTSGGLAAANSNNGSSNYSDRSIDLSMLTDGMVRDVEVSKSLTPNMDADAIGGTVNLTLREAQSGLHSDLQVNGGYNDLTSNWKNYKAAWSISDRFFKDAIGVRVQLNAEDKALPSQQFNAGYNGVTLLPIVSNGVVYSSAIYPEDVRFTVDNLDRKKYGGSVVLDYESDLVDLKFFTVYAQKKDHDARYDFTMDFDELYGFHNVDLFNSIYTVQDFTTEERTHALQAKFKFAGTELDASYAYTKSDYNNSIYGFYFLQNNTFNNGNVIYNILAPMPISTLMAISYPFLDENHWYMPDIDYAHNFLNDNSNDASLDYHIPFRMSEYLSGTISLGGKYHEFDRVTNGYSEYYSLLYEGGPWSPVERFGSFLQQYYPNPYDVIFDVNLGISAQNFTQNGYTAPRFLKGAYQLPPFGYDTGLLYNIGQKWQAYEPQDQWLVDGPQTYNSDMEAKEQLGAGYVMGQFNAGSNLSFVAGVRWEQVKGNYSAYSVYTNNNNQNGLIGTPAWRTIDAVHADFFPSVNIKYQLSENVQFFGAYYKSASRPNFSDLAPLIDYALAGNPIHAAGNPYLGPALASNFDIGGSVFSNDIGLFTADFFYKEIKDLPYDMPGYMPSPYGRSLIYGAPSDMLNRLPPVAYFDTAYLNQAANQNTSCTVPINNPENAFARGIELSWQTHLWYLPGILSGLVLDLNVAFMGSNALYPYFYFKGILVQDTSIHHGGGWPPTFYNTYLTRAGSLLNMPDVTYNAIIGWDYLGFSSRVSFKYQGKTLANLYPAYFAADTYYNGTSLIDIMLKQKLTDHLSIFADFVNIGSHIDSYYMNTSAGVLTTSQQMYGFSAQFGAGYVF